MALGLVIGTAVSFSGIVLAIGAILTPTTFRIPREYIVVFALSPLIMLVFAIRKEVTIVDAIVLLLVFVTWIAYVAVRESQRETATFRNLEIIEEADELEEQRATSGQARTSAVDMMSPVAGDGRALRSPGIAEEAEEQEPVRTRAVHTTSPVHRHERSLRDPKIAEEAHEQEVHRATSDPVEAQAIDTMSLFKRQGRWSGWINLGLAVIAIGGIVVAPRPSPTRPIRSSTSTPSRAPCSAPRS